jgi:hypothetical protein
MSSSCRNTATVLAASILGFSFAGEAAAQSYFVPTVELSSEYHTNRELTPVPGQEDAMVGYIATMQALIGKRTQRSQTEFRPRVRLQEYPDRSGVDPVDLFLDLQSDFRTLKGIYSILASASRQDSFNAEYGTAGIDTTGPETPESHNDTGIVFVGDTRTELRMRPSMQYKFTERTGFSAQVGYDKVDYEDQAITARQDYSDVTLETLLTHQLRPLSQLEVGPYVSRYKSTDTGNRTDSAGLVLGWNYDVSEISQTSLTTSVERARIDDPTFASNRETETNWGVEFKGFRKGRASRIDYAVGRYLAASGIGSRVQRDELRAQYLRQLTPRFDYRGAVRGGTEERLGFADNSRDRNYVRAEFFVRWFMSQTLYISAGYRYSWQKYKSFPDDATDNAALVLFGFRGLDIRRNAVRGAE